MKHFNKLIVFLITIVLTMTMFGAVSLGANEPKDISIRTLDVLLMPEYDTPDLLEVTTVTMYNASDKPFQGELVWRVPKGATNVVVVKNEDVNGTAAKSLGQVRSGQEYDELVWTPTEAIPAKSQKTWHIEYYDPTAIQGTTDKKFDYQFQQPFEVTVGSIAILQPTKATNFKTEPAPGNQQSTQQGNILGFPIKAVKANQAVIIKASYTKTDPNPSVSNNPAQGGQEQTQGNQPAAGTKNQTTLYALIALIIIIAAVAIIIIMKNDVSNERREIIKKGVTKKSHPDFYDDIDDFEEIDSFEDDQSLEDDDDLVVNHDLEEKHELIVEAEEDLTVNDANNIKSEKMAAKKALKNKFEKGLITEVDYYEELANLEDE